MGDKAAAAAKKGDKLGRQGGSGSQEQRRREIMKGDKLGRQGGSGSQEQPRMKIMKGDKGDKAGEKGFNCRGFD